MKKQINRCKYCGCTDDSACKRNWFWLNENNTICFDCIETYHKELVKVIWNNPFRNGLYKLKKEDLIYIINSLAAKINMINDPNQDMYWKDVAFNEKCEIIRAIDEDFFKREAKE